MPGREVEGPWLDLTQLQIDETSLETPLKSLHRYFFTSSLLYFVFSINSGRFLFVFSTAAARLHFATSA